jgi:ribosomal protein S14
MRIEDEDGGIAICRYCGQEGWCTEDSDGFAVCRECVRELPEGEYEE